MQARKVSAKDYTEALAEGDAAVAAYWPQWIESIRPTCLVPECDGKAEVEDIYCNTHAIEREVSR